MKYNISHKNAHTHVYVLHVYQLRSRKTQLPQISPARKYIVCGKWKLRGGEIQSNWYFGMIWVFSIIFRTFLMVLPQLQLFTFNQFKTMSTFVIVWTLKMLIYCIHIPLTLLRCLKAALCVVTGFSLTYWGNNPVSCHHYLYILLKLFYQQKKLEMKERVNVKILIRKYNLIEHVLNQMY